MNVQAISIPSFDFSGSQLLGMFYKMGQVNQSYIFENLLTLSFQKEREGLTSFKGEWESFGSVGGGGT